MCTSPKLIIYTVQGNIVTTKMKGFKLETLEPGDEVKIAKCGSCNECRKDIEEELKNLWQTPTLKEELEKRKEAKQCVH